MKHIKFKLSLIYIYCNEFEVEVSGVDSKLL